MSRPLLDLALRRVREGSGSYGPRPSQSWTQSVPDVSRILDGIPFLIIGGLATRLFMPERMTLDVDVLVRADDIPAAEAALIAAQGKKRGDLSVGGSSWELPGGRVLDLVGLDEPWLDAALSAPAPAPDGQPYAALPWLVLLKLAASRAQDLADLTRMLALADEPTLEAVRCAVARYRPADAEDLESLVNLGRLETWSSTDRKQK